MDDPSKCVRYDVIGNTHAGVTARWLVPETRLFRGADLCVFTRAFNMEARSAGDVLCSLFDLHWLHHRGSYERACSVLQLCEHEKGLQTGATDCGSVHRNSWGCSSGLSGDDITWQVYIWLIFCSHSLASSPRRVLSLIQATRLDRTGELSQRCGCEVWSCCYATPSMKEVR